MTSMPLIATAVAINWAGPPSEPWQVRQKAAEETNEHKGLMEMKCCSVKVTC